MTAPARTSLTRRGKAAAPRRQTIVSPLEIQRLSSGDTRVPDPIEFTLSDRYLGKDRIYPRQGTMLKVIFLRDDMLTDFDLEVIGEWEETFKRTGNEGVSPQILERIRINKAAGRPWFREVLGVIGRRGGKGHIGGIAGAYVLWNFMHRPGGPQHYYGIDPNKRLTSLVFAGKKEQAVANQWRDLTETIIHAPCFGPYLSRTQAERVSVMAPTDVLRMQEMLLAGVDLQSDPATFEILPSASTMMAGRGPASFMLHFDEMAHIVATGANRSAEEIYSAATPSLDQFGLDGFIYEGSSPWQMVGQFYENWKNAIALEEDGKTPSFPEMVMFQLPSWGPYEDWDRAHEIPMRPARLILLPGIPTKAKGKKKTKESPAREVPARCYPKIRSAIQTYDEQMRQLEKANPEAFAVERRSHWAQSLAAYLNAKKIEEAFGPWKGKPLLMTTGGPLSVTYAAHGDPSKVGDNFGFAIAHTEPGDESTHGIPHVVFDVLKAWRPSDFDDGQIDYLLIQEELQEKYIRRFRPSVLTFDQFNSVHTIGLLNKYVRDHGFPKQIRIYERTATHTSNWREAEMFKAALNMGLIHLPRYDAEGNYSDDAELAELELRFLEEKNGRVDHPSSGPVQTKDIADAIMAVTFHLIGEHVAAFLGQQFGQAGIGGAAKGGTLAARVPSESAHTRLAKATSVRRPNAGNPARGMRRR